MLRLGITLSCLFILVLGCPEPEPTNQELCDASETCVVSGEGDDLSFDCKGDMKWEDADDPKNFNCISCDDGFKWASTNDTDLSCVEICKYPEDFSQDGLVLGEVAPPTAWDDAYFGDGTQGSFSFEEFYCDEDNDKVALIIIVSTGWCPNCPQYMEHVNDTAAVLDAAGAKVVYWIMDENSSSTPASNLYAHNYVDNKSGPDNFSVRVGDATTKWVYNDGKTVEEKPDSGNYAYVPFGYLIKRDNMKVVDDETTNDPDGPGIIYHDFLALLEQLKTGHYDDM